MRNQDFKLRRRDLLKTLAFLFLYTTPLRAQIQGSAPAGAAAGFVPAVGANRDNFRVIYESEELRAAFLNFLKNVFHLYPEEELHTAIFAAAKAGTSDAEAYRALTVKIPELKPLLSELTYALPSLAKQKQEMTRQATELLEGKRGFDGYVEIGTPGRYVKGLRRALDIKGEVKLVHDAEPGFGATDVLERGGFRRVGEYHPLANYVAWDESRLKPKSADLITNFIGIHHSPPERLAGFVQSIARTLRPGGAFLLRDHDADGAGMMAMVGLAHDVFNAGLGFPWEYNEAETRHFKSLAEIRGYVESHGFRFTGKMLFQEGDPTKNALLRFERLA